LLFIRLDTLPVIMTIITGRGGCLSL